MNKLLAILVASFFATASFAASHTGAPMGGASAAKAAEAQKPGDSKAEAAGQAKVDAKAPSGDKTTSKMPEAQKPENAKAQSKAGAKRAEKAKAKKDAVATEEKKS